MDVVEYLKTLHRMCDCECRECELGKRLGVLDTCALWQKANPEEAVAIVEQWAKEHPVKTRQSEFLKQWPDAQLDCCGIVEICPSDIDTTIHQNCSADKCGGCRREFWLAEGK